jgi:hypothetical protein
MVKRSFNIHFSNTSGVHKALKCLFEFTIYMNEIDESGEKMPGAIFYNLFYDYRGKAVFDLVLSLRDLLSVLETQDDKLSNDFCYFPDNMLGQTGELLRPVKLVALKALCDDATTPTPEVKPLAEAFLARLREFATAFSVSLDK